MLPPPEWPPLRVLCWVSLICQRPGLRPWMAPPPAWVISASPVLQRLPGAKPDPQPGLLSPKLPLSTTANLTPHTHGKGHSHLGFPICSPASLPAPSPLTNGDPKLTAARTEAWESPSTPFPPRRWPVMLLGTPGFLRSSAQAHDRLRPYKGPESSPPQPLRSPCCHLFPALAPLPAAPGIPQARTPGPPPSAAPLSGPAVQLRPPPPGVPAQGQSLRHGTAPTPFSCRTVYAGISPGPARPTTQMRPGQSHSLSSTEASQVGHE